MPRLLSCVVFMACFISQGWAVGLSESYVLALGKDPRLKAAEFRLDATRFDLSKAEAGYLPKVQLSLSQGRGSTDAETGNPLSSGQRSYTTKNYALTLRQPLINFALSPDRDKAKDSISISELQLQGEVLKLFSRLSERYFNVLYADDVLRTYRNKQNSLDRQRIQADKRFKAGLAVKNDIAELDAEIALVNAQMLEAELQLVTARKQFELLVGGMAPQLNGLDYQKLKQLILDQRSLDDWLAVARSKSPELLQAEKEMQVQKHQHDKDRAMHYPTLDLLLTRSQSESDTNIAIGSRFDTLSGVLQLNVPIYSGGYLTASANQSAALIEAYKQNQDVRYTEITEKMAAEYSSMHNARHLIAAYDDAIRFYEASLAGAAKAYLAGTRTLTDILKMRDRLSDTQLSLSKTCYTYLISYIRLKELSGELVQEDLISLDALLQENMFVFNAENIGLLMGLDE